MVDEYLQAAYEDFHQASVELGKNLEHAPHSEQTEILRTRVKLLRKNLLSKCHEHLFSHLEGDRLKR